VAKKPPPPRDVHVFAPLGSNPAQLTALTWALARERRMRVVGARLVLFARGAHFLADELLGDRGGLSQLHDVLGGDHLPRGSLRWCVPERGRGRPLEDDDDAEGQRLFGDAALREARACLHDAGDLPVVFALVGGRRRTLTVLTTLVAQYLARPGDHVVDLRFEPRDAETPGRFFFPEQRDQRALASKGGAVRPQDVTVRAIDVALPRLRAFTTSVPARTFEELLSGGQSAIDAAAPLRLRLDLQSASSSALHVDREHDSLRIVLTAPERVVIGAMVRSAKRARDGWFEPLSPERGAFVRLIRELPWTRDVRHAALQYVHRSHDDALDAQERLSQTRSRLVRKLREHATRDGDPRLAALVPELDRKTKRERFRLAEQTELLLPKR
jgi:hypothetical protein